MEEALGITSSIIAVLQLSASTIKYCRSVKDASKDCKALVSELISTRGFLETLKENLDGTDSQVLTSLRTSGGPLDCLHIALQELDSKLSKTAAASGLKKFGMSLSWPFSTNATFNLLRILESQRLLLGLALDNDHIQLSRSIKRDSAATRLEIETLRQGMETIMSGVASLESKKADEKKQKILSWLSSVNPIDTHETIASKREPETGKWFLDSFEYKEWLSGANKCLFCAGIPGAGKTYLASLIIDDLRSNHLRSDLTVGLAWVYCDYAKKESQTALANMCSLLQQLVRGLGTIPEKISSFYSQNASRLSLEKCRQAIQATAKMYSQVFIVVDALDECHDGEGNRDNFITELQELPENFRLLITSRPIKAIETEFCHDISVKVLAQDSDIKKYVSARLISEKWLAKLVRADNQLPSQIQTKITASSEGMFLMAKLHMDDLARKAKRTKTEFKQTLNTLPKKLDETYQNASERIASQDEDDFTLARQVLSWTTLCFEPLSIKQLQHAIAFQNGLSEEDEDSLLNSDYLVSVCVGLVTCDNEEKSVRFVHYTTADYFRHAANTLFPVAQIQVPQLCLEYSKKFCAPIYEKSMYAIQTLSPMTDKAISEGDSCVLNCLDEWHRMSEKYPFLIYTAHHLVGHIRSQFQQSSPDNKLIESVRNLWLDKQSRIKLRGLYLMITGREHSWTFPLNIYPQLDELEFAVFFGLQSNVKEILTFPSCEGKFEPFQSPSKASMSLSVCIAAFLGFDKILDVLLRAGGAADGLINVFFDQSHSPFLDYHLDSGHRNAGLHACFGKFFTSSDWSAIECAIFRRDLSMLKTLLGSSSEITEWWPDEDEMNNPLFFPSSQQSPEILACLMDYGFKQTGLLGETILHDVVGKLDEKSVRVVLERGVRPNATDNDGLTPLHYLIKRYDYVDDDFSQLELLLKYGADLNSRTKFHTTALMYAKGTVTAIKFLMPNIIKSLSDAGFDVDGNDSTHFVLYVACENLGFLRNSLLQKIIEGCHDIDTFPRGENALQIACHRPDGSDICRLLLDHGADPNKGEEDEIMAPLHLAGRCKNHHIATLLLERGAVLESEALFYVNEQARLDLRRNSLFNDLFDFLSTERGISIDRMGYEVEEDSS